MTILNVVQPEEFDPSSFTEIDGKLKVAISSQEGNILRYKDDGLFAAAGGGNGVLERYVYTIAEGGNVVHKGINFHIYLIDGALKGTVYGIDPNAIDPDDIVYYSGGSLGTTFDDEKYVLELPWAVEHEQRVVLKMHQNGNPVLWVVRVIRPKGDDVGVLLESVTIVIDEMVNVGDLTTEEPTEGPVIPELNSSHTLMHIGTIPPGMQNRHYTVALYDGDKFAIVRLDDDKQPIFDSPDNITGQLAHPYADYSVKEQLSYCPITGTVIYYDGNNYWGIIPNNRMVLDLPTPTDNLAIIGTTLGMNAELGECIVFYSMDSQSISYQILTDLSDAALRDRRTFSAPEDNVYDCVVSGTSAHYLYVRDGNYVLQTIDLLSDDVTENMLAPYSVDDKEAKLIPTAVGGVIAYIDKGVARLAFPYLAKVNTGTGETLLELADPAIIEGKLIFPDMLPNVGFAMNMVGMNFFKFFVDGISVAMTRFTADLLDGSFSLSSAPIPDNYMSLLMSGKMSIPLSYDLTTIGYDGSTDGDILSYDALEMSAVAAMYQSSALFKFDNGLAVLAHTPAGDLAIVKVNEDNTTDTTAYELHAEYSNTVQGFVEVAPALGVAVWKTRVGKIVFARFSETNSDVYITELGDSRYPSSWIMISKDVDGNYFVKEMQTNNGLELRVWCIAPDDTVTVYDHPDINIEGSFLEGSDILGDKLLAFGSTGGVTNIRVLDARTGAALTQGNFAYAGSFLNLWLQRIDHETLLVIENIYAVADKPASIKVTLLKITATEVMVIKKSTLALGEWESLDGRSLTNNTYAGVDGTISYQFAIRGAKRYYVKITASPTDFTVYEQEITQEILDKAGMLVIGGSATPVPSVNLFNGDTGYLQHDLKLTSLNTFALDMVEHDNSPKPIAFTAKWNPDLGQILLNGTMANPAPDTWTYIRLAVDTPSGVTHETKSKIAYDANGVFKDNLWVIGEPGEYVFRVSNWDGGPVMEARASVPNEGLDFTPPTVTPDGDGSWVLTTTNTGAIGRGLYGIYRSRDPISILDDYYNGSRYISDDAVGVDPMLLRFTIPASERNGTWYIMVGHQGDSIGGVWTPTFLTYTA